MPNSDFHIDTVRDNRELISPGSPAVEQLQAELRQEHERYLRVLADFENFRRRVERERERDLQSGKEGLIMAMVTALDAFDKALVQLKHAAPAVLEGLQAVQRKLAGVLEAEGVIPYSSIGQQFDPQLHEAITTAASDAEHPPGAVVEEFQRGYRWGDTLLRPARVSVAM